MSNDDLFNPTDLTEVELNAIALADAELDMLADLVKMRRAKGLTQDDVAAAIGRNKSAISRFERLDSDPRLSTVRRYARAIGALITHKVTDFQSSNEATGPRIDEPVQVDEAKLAPATTVSVRHRIDWDISISRSGSDESPFLPALFGEAASAEATSESAPLSRVLLRSR